MTKTTITIEPYAAGLYTVRIVRGDHKLVNWVPESEVLNEIQKQLVFAGTFAESEPK